MKKTGIYRIQPNRRGALKMILLFLLAALLLVAFLSRTSPAHADDKTPEEELSQSIEDVLENLDLSELEAYYNGLDTDQREYFGGNLYDFIRRIVTGEDEFGYGGFIEYLLKVIGSSLYDILPAVMAVVAIAALLAIVGSMKGSFASASVDSIISFAGVGLAGVTVLIEVMAAVQATTALITGLRLQMEAIFPIIFTLMSAVGASGSLKVYQPAVAVLSVSMTQLISVIILPLILITIVFAVVGNLSDSFKLTGSVKFLNSLTKWILYTSFFLFIGFLSVQGITASVYDNISIRTAKFALSQYIPVIGGYLSEGFNIIAAGSVLIKNAVGLTAIFMMLLTVLPTFIQVVLLVLALKLSAAVIEPFSSDRIGNMLTSLSNGVSLLLSVIAGITFLSFMFMILIIASGNVAF